MADLTLFFNNPNSSDIVLVVNGEQFHLLSDILEKHTDFFKDMKVTSQSISTSKDVIVSLVSKKVVNIEDPFLEKDTVAKVLKFMYGGHLEINATNVNDIFHVSNTIKIKSLVAKCFDQIKENPNFDTLLEDCLKAINEQSPMKTIYQHMLKSFLYVYEKEKIFDFTADLSFENLCSFLELDVECDENLIYDIVENYDENNDISDGRGETLFSLIKLDKLSGDYLINKAKNNSYINKEKYHEVLEKFYIENKKNIITDGFCFGKLAETYPGYRLITEKECELPSFVKAFGEYYKKNNGLKSLDNFDVDALCNDKRPLCIGKWWIRLQGLSVNKNKVYQFAHSHGSAEELIKQIFSIRSHPDNTNNSIAQGAGLFVLINTHF